MLQNACRALWNITQTVLMRLVAGTLHLSDDPLAESATDIDALRKALWQKFYFGADSLLDMMVQIQEQLKAETEQHKKVKNACPETRTHKGYLLNEFLLPSLQCIFSPSYTRYTHLFDGFFVSTSLSTRKILFLVLLSLCGGV